MLFVPTRNNALMLNGGHFLVTEHSVMLNGGYGLVTEHSLMLNGGQNRLPTLHLSPLL